MEELKPCPFKGKDGLELRVVALVLEINNVRDKLNAINSDLVEILTELRRRRTK